MCQPNSFFSSSLLSLLLSEKKWFTDEPENAYPRNIQIKPMSTHMANQVNQYKSTSSLIPPIREVEDECWTQGFLADTPDICTPFQRKPGRDHPWRRNDDDDSYVEDWHTSLHSFFQSRVGLIPKQEGTSYVYTFNVTSMLLDILFIIVSIVMYITTIK